MARSPSPSRRRAPFWVDDFYGAPTLSHLLEHAQALLVGANVFRLFILALAPGVTHVFSARYALTTTTGAAVLLALALSRRPYRVVAFAPDPR